MEADVMKRIVAAGGPFATILCEIALGVNPKAPITPPPHPPRRGDPLCDWFNRRSCPHARCRVRAGSHPRSHYKRLTLH